MNQPFFEPVSAQVRFPDLERQVLAYWKESDAFHRSLELTRGKKPYVFYDGPPFATGLPHYGHLTAGTLKDIIPRYWTMRGHYVSRRFGWDCHGLPVENEMEKQLRLGGKKDIEKLGIHVFNEACRSIVLRYTRQWEDTVVRMGRWVDFVNQYRTMDAAYMESIWWVFKRVWERGLVYQGFRVQPYCPRCTTPLSNFEVNEGYRDVKGASITVSFPLVDDPSVKVLVWTTTPWTLPSNVALAAGPDITYVKVRDKDDYYILAKDRLQAYYRSDAEYAVVEEMKGTALEGLRYRPLFDYFKDRSPEFFRIVTDGFVSTEDGTGVVHLAPAFGEDDFGVGSRFGWPIVCPVDEQGRFTAEVPDYEGKTVFEADEPITARLKAMKRLVRKETLEHRYPHCYRCDTPLIYKAITTWFMKIDPLRENMLENNRRIHWVPGHLQNGRFGKWLEGARDWNISRNRYWGTPIPVWLCGCGHRECAGGLDDLHALAGRGDRARGGQVHRQATAAMLESLRADARERLARFKADPSWAERVLETRPADFDLHRHIVDQIEIVCPKCGGKMSRTPEVLDCWFESGSMPYAQGHYPFENKEVFDAAFPADFIAEGLDQTRGWFYTLTVLASAIFDREAFKNVVVNGIILAEDGKKLSKRLKNYVDPNEILDRLGADSLRLFLINSPAVKAEDLRFNEKGVTEMARAVLLPYWNAYSFFVTYANVDGFVPPVSVELTGSNELDRWIVSLLNDVISQINTEMEQYNLYKVVPLLVDFIENLTNWYIRRSRRRFWKSGNDDDKNGAYTTLYYVLSVFSRVMAPVLPFTTEVIFRNLSAGVRGGAASVHLQPYPKADESLIDRALEAKMELARRAVGLGRALRSRYTLKNRQPLSDCTVIVRDEAKRALLSDMEQLIADELNVKRVRFGVNEDEVVTVSAKANFRALGKVFGPRMKEAAALIERLDRGQIATLESGGSVPVLDHGLTLAEIEIRRTKRAGVEVETEGDMTVALNTELTPALINEGIAREFINRVQTIRKEQEFNVTDRIAVRFGAPPQIAEAVSANSAYIQAETLAVSLAPADGDGGVAVEINGSPVRITVTRAQDHAGQ